MPQELDSDLSEDIGCGNVSYLLYPLTEGRNFHPELAGFGLSLYPESTVSASITVVGKS